MRQLGIAWLLCSLTVIGGCEGQEGQSEAIAPERQEPDRTAQMDEGDPAPTAPSADAPESPPAQPADAACKNCTGPGDWGAGDYPPELRAQKYLEIADVPGQLGAVRGYKVHVPPGYDPARPAPVVFALHGLMQNPVMFVVDGSGWVQKSDAEGFVLIMPTGVVKNANGTFDGAGSWNAGVCCGDSATRGLDDVALLRAILKEVGTHLNLDLGRVYATGLSNGGFMSFRLACEASDVFVAIAPGAGAVGLPDIGAVNVGNANFTSCKPTHKVAVLAMHGTTDGLVPYRTMQPSLEIFARANGCMLTTQPATQPLSGGDTQCLTYAGCAEGGEVTGCTVDKGGHCWFGDPGCGTGAGILGAIIVGNNSNTLKNTDAAWEFFKRFSR